MKKKLIVIDGNALVHRAFHALPKLTTKQGEVVNAVYGFLLVFLKAINELSPDFICASFDLEGPTFRHKEYKQYKATRVKAPDELYHQIPIIKNLLKSFSVPIYEKQGFEADDVIATIVRKPEVEKIESIVLSGDLDILQLVDQNTKVWFLRRGVKDTVLYDEQKVKQRLGLSPTLLPDFKGLRGDPSDNLPGVPGIGEKTALQLLKQFGSLENLYQEIEKGTEKSQTIKPRIRELLIKNKESAFLSKRLAKTKEDLDIDFQLKDCDWKNYNHQKVIETLKNLEFFSLIKRLPGEEKKQNSLF